MKSKNILKEMTPYQPGQRIEQVKKEYGLNRIVKLASNENPFGYSGKVADHFSRQPSALNIYPDGYTTDLRHALAAKLDVSENQLIFGSGTDEIVQIIGRAFLYPGINTVMAAPTFPQYKHNALVEGAEVKEVPTVNGYHDLTGMLEAIDDKTNVVWLCSPNNPTGCLIPRDQLYAFMEKCPEDILVVLDEAYFEYINGELHPDVLKHLNQYNNLVVLRTFSKAYGLAGLRVGYGIANHELITAMDVVRGPFNTSSIAQHAALLALEDDEFIEDTVSRNSMIKKSFEQFLDSIGWHYFDSHTNFLLVSTPISGEQVFQHLLEKGFIVRPGEGLGVPESIRVTIGNETDMQQLQEVLYQLHHNINEGS
ncbi:histidinol-phosphate aminotransferase [Lentibacillus halodurans]|uniref:Histidinol-phosphate aminotransferase n=1 Tax=Lentibacillus halodurans TaxID=237679 RepID=A0A1I0VBY8_9BACI|nr:histidinol-phosphate transaminase [Lentibacillus halodurans]SFA73851.1 histidinol-phosphate aminotransferase [Lentibacillus halodurans]